MYNAEALKRIAQEKAARTGILDLGRLGLSLETIPPSLWELGHLEELNLGNRYFYNTEKKKWEGFKEVSELENQVSSIPPQLYKLGELRVLRLDSNQLQKLENLDKLASLQSLDLSSNQIQKLENLDKLASLQSLDLYNNQIQKLENLDGLASLQSLYLYNNQIQKLENLDGLASLQSLDFENNQIQKLENLDGLASLQSLDLSNNQIQKLENLDGLASLQSLYLHNNQIQKLENLDGLASLQSLYLSNNQIQKLENLDGLASLQSLDLSNNQIQKLENLDGLASLQSLDFENNQIQKLENLDRLASLQSLDLRGNQIQKLENLDGLASLQSLNLRNNKIQKLENLDKLASLQSLDLFNNQIQKLENLDKLDSLQSLDLFNNQIQKLENLDKLDSLQSLDLRYNQIQKLENLDRLDSLQSLDLSGNQIQKLENLDRLDSLQSLDLRYNQIQKLENLDKLDSLQSLDLSSNQIQQLENLDRLDSLQSLDLSGNQIQQLENLDRLASLQSLNLENNLIQQLENLDKLASLQSLNLRNNQIQQLENLDGLQKLKKIDFGHNEITDLKPLLAQPNLEEVELAECPIQTVPAEIAFSRNWEMIRNYLLSNPDTPFNEVKLILAGNTEAGKTNFSDLLQQGDAFQFDQEHDTTHGIQVGKLVIEQDHPLWPAGSPLQSLTVNSWDFGGQDFYHGTHAMFFKQGAVYLLLYVKDKEKEQHYEKTRQGSGRYVCFPEDYWLDNIRHHAPDGTIFYVQNKTDRDGKAPLQNDMAEQYGLDTSLSAHISIKLATAGKSPKEAYELRVLQERLIRQLLEIPEREVTLIQASWLRVRDFIYELQSKKRKLSPDNPFQALSRKQPYLSLSEFKACCEGVVENFGQFAEAFLRLFDRRGVLIHYAGHPVLGDYVFLNPEWMASKLYELLQKEVLESREGIFDLEYARQRLGNDAGLLLELMEEFEVIFPEPQKPETYVAVQYLPYYNRERDLDMHYDNIPFRLRVQLPLFHQQRIVRQLLVRLGGDASYRQRKLRRDCILLYTTEGHKASFWGQEQDNQGTIAIHADTLDLALQLWLELLMLYFSPFEELDMDYGSDRERDFGEQKISPKQRLKKLFTMEEAFEQFLRSFEEKRDRRFLKKNRGNSNKRLSQLNSKEAAVYWGMFFRENLAYARAKWKADNDRENPKQDGLNRFDTYAKHLLLSTEEGEMPNQVSFWSLLENVAESNVPNTKGHTIPVFPFIDYLNSLGYSMKKQPELRIFISYSHKQQEYYEVFKNDFESFAKIDGINISVFTDEGIPLGAKWDDYLQDKVANCDVMLLLVSQTFMNSTYIKEKEFGAAVQRLKAGNKMLIVPIYFSPCLFHNDQDLSSLQFFKPLASDFGMEHDEDFSYADLVGFKPNGDPLPNSKRERYMVKLIKKLTPELKKLAGIS